MIDILDFLGRKVLSQVLQPATVVWEQPEVLSKQARLCSNKTLH